MSCPFSGKGLSRRGFFAGSGSLVVAAAARPALAATEPLPPGSASSRDEPFYGPHQGGIATEQQAHSYFAAFDIMAKNVDDVVKMLRTWTEAAARLTSGMDPAGAESYATSLPDGGSCDGMSPARLTLTFGFGPGLFTKDGHDRFGLATRRPEALVDLPRFEGDQLDPLKSGGDLSVQACCDDPQVAFHAVRELIRLAYDTAQVRWVQTGFVPNTPKGDTPRNLMGFRDGTNNVRQDAGRTQDLPRNFDEVVWSGREGPDWMVGGSYVVARRIRISLEHWDRTDVDFQEEVVGRHKRTGAPIGKSDERDTLDLERQDSDGNYIVAETSHVRLGAAMSNDGAQVFRRAYSYNDGVTFTAERWPPWRQGMLYDAGLFFLCYQQDPRSGFIKIFDTMAKLDALNQFTTHTGSGIFACPGGVRTGEFIGQRLFAYA